MKSLLLMLVFTCTLFSSSYAASMESGDKEMLLRLPLMSDKNATVIANALDSVPGIKNIEACYELKVMIIGYDSEIINDETIILNIINEQRINTTVEKIYSSDIPKIRSKYQTTTLNGAGKIKN